ncbi:metallophosphoesterase family protein [Altererythrobacter lutimaris]|uniref:Serine/threonine protein phosphatase n=1 Tax=Altererythrobacter lutimaris TaxID=2743979 RepID=A0A850HBY5_9SPHN|nr:metallophosphoesterase family protein [Altererythrobacter lutimaris]NVE94795.1 serine/threonine protein phosphatase [Altererythrobacter lutimaris]
MISKLFNDLLGRETAPRRLPRVPAGTRYYVIGDIHGRMDLFAALIGEIEADDNASDPADTHIILLGDLVDRGPDSAAVVQRAREWTQTRKVRILVGNHEEMFLRSFDEIDVLHQFLKHGGRETVLSYGLSPEQFSEMTLDEHFAALPLLVPQADRDFIASFEEMIIAGDYAFVHAGVDPDLPFNQQQRTDLLWIREKFLSHRGPLPKVVIHGHTIFNEVVDCGNRIGIDTGAFRTGVLTALVLEADSRRLIQAIEEDGAVRTENREYDE